MIRKYTKRDGTASWQARVIDEHGKNVLKTFASKRLADEYVRHVADTKARIRAGLEVAHPIISYDELCELYLDSYTARSKPWFETMLLHSRTRFGKVKLPLLLPDQIGHWLHSELAYAPKTKTHILTAMRQVLDAGVEWGYLPKSPARPKAIRPPGTKRLTPIQPFELWADVARLADAAGRYGPLIRFRCATGLRAWEAFDLRWSDIDIPNRLVHVRGTKNANAERSVELAQAALSALRDLPRPLNPNTHVFTTITGKRIDSGNFRRHAWEPALGVTRLSYREPRQMRHTFATLALAAGCTLDWVSKQMGHSSVEITRRYYALYIKATNDRQRALLDTLESSGQIADTRASQTP